MRDTGFLPLARVGAASIAPTQKPPAGAAGQALQGVVHDPTARRMGAWRDRRACLLPRATWRASPGCC
jgi:hypothetical protein